MFIPTHLPAAAGGGVGVGTTNADPKNPFVFNSVLTLNDPTDDVTDTYEVVAVTVDDQFALASEPLPQSDGMQIYIPRKPRKLIHMDGIIHAASLAKLEYKAMQLARYLDPVNAFWDDTASTMEDDKGFLPLVFDIPTTDTDTYATGIITVKAYVRNIQRAVKTYAKYLGYNAPFGLVFEMIDPRFYETTAQSVSLSSGSTVHASTTEYPTHPTITVVFSGAPASVLQLNRTGPNDENGNDLNVRIDPTQTLGGAAAGDGDTVTIDMKTGIVKLNGNQRDDFLVAGYTNFWQILPGSNTVFRTGPTLASATMSYNRAYA